MAPRRSADSSDAFYDRVERDDLLSGLFPGGVSEEHRANVTLWWAEVLGGPADYTAQLGGYPRMLTHHRDLHITPAQRFRFASTMSLAADDAALPDDPEFRAAFVGYVEWGTPRPAELAGRCRPCRGGAGAALGMGRGTALRAEVAACVRSVRRNRITTIDFYGQKALSAREGGLAGAVLEEAGDADLAVLGTRTRRRRRPARLATPPPARSRVQRR